jgi:ABC-type sugar transport system ATPase subunit
MEALGVQAIRKSYDGNAALTDVSFEVPKGTVLAVCGENGAGKSTLMKILAGAVAPNEGEIRIDGAAIRFADPRQALERGIHTVYQELSLLPHLSVAENILLGQMPMRLGGWAMDWRETHRIAEAVLHDFGIDDLDVRRPVSDFSISQQQMVEIAKALVSCPEVLILDEPTAILSLRESRLLFARIRQLASAGTIIIYISHRLEEVFEIASRVLVLKDGFRVLDEPIADLDRDRLVRAMVGRPLAAIYPERQTVPGDPVLECSGLAREGVFRDISFQVAAGEIVGMFGLVGSGRTDVARALFGAAPADRGDIRIAGAPVTINIPQDAVGCGIAMVTEDRKIDGLALDCSVLDNGGLATMGRVSRWGVLDRREQRRMVKAKLDELAVRPRRPERPVRQLSGGNQQKVVLTKWLLLDKAKLFIFDEPTRGVDVATKVEIYRMIAALADSGMAVLLISSDLPEVLGMSDRLLVMRGGRMVAELPRAEFSMEAAFSHAAGMTSQGNAA